MSATRRHWLVLAVWALFLATIVVRFSDRIFGGGFGASSPPSAEPAVADDVSRVHRELRAMNPLYNGRARFGMVGGRIAVADLSGTGIDDPTPLRRLPLEAVDLSSNPLADISGLRGMRLRRLSLEATDVTDLRPLAGMPLTELHLNRTPVSDLAPIADCPLVSLTLERTPVVDISPVATTKLTRLHIADSAVTDLTVLSGTNLTRLIFTPGRILRGLDAVRAMGSIREIGPTLEQRMAPERFWALYDRGQLP